MQFKELPIVPYDCVVPTESKKMLFSLLLHATWSGKPYEMLENTR